MPVTMAFRFQRDTARAICVLNPEGVPMWLPKSQVSYGAALGELRRNDPITLTLSDWIAREKGIRAPVEEPDVDEDKYKVVGWGPDVAPIQQRFAVTGDTLTICVCDDERTAQMIAAALALTEGKV